MHSLCGAYKLSMRNNLAIILLFTFSSASGQADSKRENYKPLNLEEAVAQLKIIHDDTTKKKILEMSESEFLRGAHFGLGMWMRNNWGLWKGKTLAKYFYSIGVYHPDDMSAVILASYYRELHGQDWKVDEQVQYYQDYWKRANEHLQRLQTDTAYQKMIQARNDSLQEARFEQKKAEWTTGKQVSGYVEHRCGILADFYLRTRIEGTVIEWRGDQLVLHVDQYIDEKKKKGVIKCYGVKNDTILIKDHYLFDLKEN